MLSRTVAMFTTGQLFLRQFSQKGNSAGVVGRGKLSPGSDSVRSRCHRRVGKCTRPCCVLFRNRRLVTVFQYYFIYLSYFVFWLTLYLLSYKLWSMLKILEPGWVLTNCFVINSRSMYIIIVSITKYNNVKVVGEFMFDFLNNSN